MVQSDGSWNNGMAHITQPHTAVPEQNLVPGIGSGRTVQQESFNVHIRQLRRQIGVQVLHPGMPGSLHFPCNSWLTTTAAAKWVERRLLPGQPPTPRKSEYKVNLATCLQYRWGNDKTRNCAGNKLVGARVQISHVSHIQVAHVIAFCGACID